MIFLTQNNELTIFGNTIENVKNKLATLNKNETSNGFTPTENLVKELSFDEARDKLEEFNQCVVQNGMSLETYCYRFAKNDEIFKKYVTTTDQQSQSVQGLMKAT